MTSNIGVEGVGGCKGEEGVEEDEGVEGRRV